jgi:hypothetical protein
MRFIIVVLCLSACTQHNPDSCCTSADQCLALGLSEMHSCDTGKTCDTDGACVTSECSTSADCTSPDTPICENQLCIAHCTQDLECGDISGRPYCASDGTCVACMGDAQCSADAPVCDSTTHSCRGCTLDTDCSSNVCLEDVGTCADANRVLFVANGMPDTGECSSAAPCGSLGYALAKMTTVRDVIHINTPTLTPAPITLDGHVGRIDGTNTLLSRADAGNVMSMASGQMTLTGLRIGSAVGTIIPLAVSGGDVVTYGVEFLGSVRSTGGTIEMHASTLDTGGLCDTGGHFSFDGCSLHGQLMTTNCTLDIIRSRFENSSYVRTTSSAIHIANNLFVSSDPNTDPVSLDGTAGSYFQFNTMINVGATNSASTLACNAAIDVRDNILAWNSTNAPECATQYTLFDMTVGVTPAGQGNKIANVTTFFADLATSDLHLAASSPARGAGVATTITTDYDGTARADPPDVGAFQSH